MTFGISLISLATIIIALVAVLYNRGFSNTKKGKALNSEIEFLSDEIAKKDEELCKKFSA